MSELELDDCPYCGKEAVWQDDYIWNDKDAGRCGCQTVGCRGNIKNCQYYPNVVMAIKCWNTRTEK